MKKQPLALMNQFLFLLLLFIASASVYAQTPAQQALALINQARWENGQLPPLKGVGALFGAAQAHSDAMAARNFFMHCDPDTQTGAGARMTAAGYSWNSWAENLAAGFTTPSAAVAGWLNSPGHRANLLRTTVNESGVGYVFDSADISNVRSSSMNTCTVDGTSGPWRHYWTQKFGRRSAVFPLVIAREAFSVSNCEADLYVYADSNPQQMRFRNDDDTWSGWRPYSANAVWALDGAAALDVLVSAQVRYQNGSVSSASDSVRVTSSCQSELILVAGFEA